MLALHDWWAAPAIPMMMIGSGATLSSWAGREGQAGEHGEDKHGFRAGRVGVYGDAFACGAVNEDGRELAAVDREHGDQVEHEDHHHAFAR